MSNFTPNTELYGREVIIYDSEGENPKAAGKLECLRSPHSATVGGVEYEWDASYDFHPEDDGTISIMGAW